MVEKARELAAEHGWLLCHQFLGVKHATSCVDMWRMCKLCATCWKGHWAAGSPWIDHRTDSHGICFYLVRFETPANAKIHYDTTGQEILNDFEGTGQIFERPPGRHISLYRVRMLGQRYAAACISDRSRHPPGLLCHRLWNWRNLRWCWESSSGGEPSRLRASLMWQPGRLTSHDSHAEHEARIRWIRWIRRPVLKKTPCSTNHLKHLEIRAGKAAGSEALFGRTCWCPIGSFRAQDGPPTGCNGLKFNSSSAQLSLF